MGVERRVEERRRREERRGEETKRGEGMRGERRREGRKETRGHWGANARVTYFWKGNRPLVWHVCAISKINSTLWNSDFFCAKVSLCVLHHEAEL